MFGTRLKTIFSEVELKVTDLFLLDSFQIGYLSKYAPQKELSRVLHEYGDIKQFFIDKHPPIKSFLNQALTLHPPNSIKDDLTRCVEVLMWELGFMIISQKYPTLIDTKTKLNWKLEEILPINTFSNKVVLDVGSGTGNIAFLVADYSKIVYAIEPTTRLREFIKEKSRKELSKNIYAIDGLLHEIPFPDGFADILITSNAIGWNFNDELHEIERVVKPGGEAIHLMISPSQQEVKNIENLLTSKKWAYNKQEFTNHDNYKTKFSKKIY